MCPAEDDRLIRRLHCCIQALPPHVTPRRVRIGGREITAFDVGPTQQFDPLDVSFEDVQAVLQAQPDCFTEPDGAVMWSGTVGRQRWDLFMQLTDDGTRMLMAELKGECPRSIFASVEAALSGETRTLMYQVPRHGLFVDRESLFSLVS